MDLVPSALPTELRQLDTKFSSFMLFKLWVHFSACQLLSALCWCTLPCAYPTIHYPLSQYYWLRKLTTEQATDMAESKIRNSSFFCRICHCDDGDLISPCHCSGTVGLLHLSCLEKWLSTNGSQSCELCNFEFQVTCQAKPLRQVNKALLYWFFL